MARNEVFRDADHLTVPVPEGVVSGDPVLVGSLPGVAQTDRADDGTATVWFKGAYRLSVQGSLAEVGTPVYITSSGSLTATAGENTLFGHTLETKGSGNAVVVVRVARV